MNAPRTIGLAASPLSSSRTRQAWTAFWQAPGQSRCIAGAQDVLTALDQHWASIAAALPAHARVLDLGCGAGAVGRALLTTRPDLHVTGVDAAKIPLTLETGLELLSGAPMESLPFEDASFAAATSQFGFEYGQTGKTALEMARVLAPGAPFSLLVRHANSAAVANDRARLAALLVFLHESTRSAFCAGEMSFSTRMTVLQGAYPHDSLIADLTLAVTSRLSRPPRERLAIWSAVEDALAPELCLAKALNVSCVAPAEMDAWVQPLRDAHAIHSISVLPDPHGDPIAWRIDGARR